MPASPTVAVVLVNYNTPDLVSRFLDRSRGGMDEVVIVDNASFVGNLGVLIEENPEARFVRLERNVGYGAGANAGAELCESDVIVVANPDVEIPPEGLRHLAAVVSQDRVGLAAPRFVDRAGRLIRSSHRREPGLLTTLGEYAGPFAAVAARLQPSWHPTLNSPQSHLHSHDTVHVLGALMAVRSDAFREVRGFDERFFLYREETDLCVRLRAADWRVVHVAEVEAVHDGDASSGGDWRFVAVRPAALRSHYQYIRKRWGLSKAVLAWLVGLTGSAVWVVMGRDRRMAYESLKGHARVRQLLS